MKSIIIKGDIKSVHAFLGAIAKVYDGWTVEEYIRLASIEKRLSRIRRPKKF